MVAVSSLKNFLRGFADLFSLVFLFFPALFFKLSYVSSEMWVALLSVLGLIAMVITVFSVVPRQLDSFALFQSWSYWQKTAFVLSFVAIGNGFVAFYYMKSITTETELLKNSVLFLGAVLVVVPSAVKNLMSIYPDEK